MDAYALKKRAYALKKEENDNYQNYKLIVKSK